MVQKALITGINGMDGSYLTEFLLEKGYEVHGIIRRSSYFNLSRLEHLNYPDKHPRLHLHYGDLTDPCVIDRLITEILPDEIYNLAAQSHVQVSFEEPVHTMDVNSLGPLYILESIRKLKNIKKIKFYQASTSEIFGGHTDIQSEKTPFIPESPYGISKLSGHWTTILYRKSYHIFACCGILFNHTSPRRGENFVEQKIVRAARDIVKGKQDCLSLGNIYSYRDIGHSRDYVEAMWKMLQQPFPDDYVVATGKCFKIKEIVERVFYLLNVVIEWSGTGVEEVGKDQKTGKVIVKIDPRLFRPSEVHKLRGDSTKARDILNWEPSMNLKDILQEMINYSG